jgi:valyl-tRNA synthetase
MSSDTAERAQLGAQYEPAVVEQRWYDFWEQSGYFKPDPGSDAPTFVITIPPPNVTGDLHVGHALTFGIEDVIGRFKRMQGFNTLILPGTDHAGIATQNVVEKELATEGLTRHDLGREKFIERVWGWKEQYANNIRHQFRAMGCSFDWSRERFTMDPAYVEAVLEFFIRLYEEGQIYRGWRVINWCPRCQSAISDIEVEDIERDDMLYYLRYPLQDGSGEIQVATVRPETILGDVAVAVNPDDARYYAYVGKTALLPLLGRELPILADPMVSKEFGTGAVKITPAHDFNDFEVAERHHLDMPIAIDSNARITSIGAGYEGLTVEEARVAVLRDLDRGGYLVKTEPYQHLVPTCERCGTIVEPLLSEQWFMRMDSLAQPAIDVVKDCRVRFVPERWASVYLDWMEHIRPWTLSRQLWWGHRIPIYYCVNGHTVAGKSWPEACTECGGAIARQDPDVLDTWFSSALWPFATLGWPQQTEDLASYYPTSFMNTSAQIIYLWIARMIMTGLKFMGDVPYPVVLINPTILTKDGRRMSKSLGTGVDPLKMIAQYGADALRFGLLTSGSTHQQDIRFSVDRVEQAGRFANKVWNVARSILSHQQAHTGELALTLPDRWILSRLHHVIADVTSDLERFELSGAGHALNDFIRSELADWYLEIAKLRLYDDSDENGRFTAQAVLWSVLERVTRLLHPYMPFLTEEIWQQVRTTGSVGARQLSSWSSDLPASVMIAPWPEAGPTDVGAERDMNLVFEIIRAIRATRSEYNVDAGKFVAATIVAGARADTFEALSAPIGRLARVRPLRIVESSADKPRDAVALLVDEVTIYLPLADMTDIALEIQRLRGELTGAQRANAGVQRKLENPNFASRAPEDVIRREQERARELASHIAKLEERLQLLGHAGTDTR